MSAAAYSARVVREGVRGENHYFPPGGFPPLSTRESGLPAANECCREESFIQCSDKMNIL